MDKSTNINDINKLKDRILAVLKNNPPLKPAQIIVRVAEQGDKVRRCLEALHGEKAVMRTGNQFYSIMPAIPPQPSIFPVDRPKKITRRTPKQKDQDKPKLKPDPFPPPTRPRKKKVTMETIVEKHAPTPPAEQTAVDEVKTMLNSLHSEEQEDMDKARERLDKAMDELIKKNSIPPVKVKPLPHADVIVPALRKLLEGVLDGEALLDLKSAPDWIEDTLKEFGLWKGE